MSDWTHVSRPQYLTMETLKHCLVDKGEFVQVEVLASGEVLAKLYGPYRWENARHMLRNVG